MSTIGRKGTGPTSPEGKARSRANLIQFQRPGAKRPRHGAYSVDGETPEVQGRRAAIEALIAEDMGEITAQSKVMVELLCVVLVQIERLNTHLTTQGPVTKGGLIRPALETLIRLSKSALDLANSLGLTPAARSRMGLKSPKDNPMAQELARLMRDLDEKDKGVQ